MTNVEFTSRRETDTGERNSSGGMGESRPQEKQSQLLCRRCPPELANPSCVRGLCENCFRRYHRMKKKSREIYPDKPLLTIEEFLRLDPSSYLKKRVDVSPSRSGQQESLCVRCPTFLQRTVASPRLGLCESCRVQWYDWCGRMKKAGKEESELTVTEFIRLCPSVYACAKRFCLCCPGENKKISFFSKSGLCTTGYQAYFMARKSKRQSQPDAPDLTIAEFLEHRLLKRRSRVKDCNETELEQVYQQ